MDNNLQVQSLLDKEGNLRVSMAYTSIPTPGEYEVVVRIEAAPINPSDLGVLLGPAEISTATTTMVNESPVLCVKSKPELLARYKERFDLPLVVGNEGCGVVVNAGSSPEAQALLGKLVGIVSGGTYCQYQAIPVTNCLPVNEQVTPKEAASCFVNPMTALCMIETMKMEGHNALIHSASASNLGQMLNKLCIDDGINLVNIVRKQKQADILTAFGAKYVCNSSDTNFIESLTDAIEATGATIAFDATGGGKLTSDILRAMELALHRPPTPYSVYGSSIHKQVYIYGNLDTSPTLLKRDFGMSWSIGGFLILNQLQKFGEKKVGELRNRIIDELQTTFSSNYTQEISLEELLYADVAKMYCSRVTGQKYLLCPQKNKSLLVNAPMLKNNG